MSHLTEAAVPVPPFSISVASRPVSNRCAAPICCASSDPSPVPLEWVGSMVSLGEGTCLGVRGFHRHAEGLRFGAGRLQRCIFEPDAGEFGAVCSIARSG